MGKILRIRTSDRATFRSCRRKWGFSSSLKRNRESNLPRSPFWLGTGFHYAFEDYHGYNKYGSPKAAWDAYVTACRKANGKDLPGDWQELVELAHAMFEYYEEWLTNRDPLKTYWHDGEPQVEVKFEIPIPLDPALIDKYNAACSKVEDHIEGVVYQGTIDRVVIDEHERLWFVDYKTAKQFAELHFETDGQISAYCVPLDTEILTPSGWKTYKQLTVGEKVFGYNTETEQIEITELENVHLPGLQEVQELSNKSFTLKATPDHKWVKRTHLRGVAYKENKQNILRLTNAEENWNNSVFVLSACYNNSDSNITPEEAALLGWIITEGTWGEYSRGKRMCVSQKKHKHEVQELLDKFPDCYSRITDNMGTSVWHLRVPFFEQLWERTGLSFDREFVGWEKFIIQMSHTARKAFCDAAMKGDGSPSNGTFYQNPGPKQELFKLAFFLLGNFPSKSTRENSFGVTSAEKWSKTVKIKSSGREEVWCPQTKLRTWVMRQNGQIAITGNCWAGASIYELPVAGFIYQQHKKSAPAEPKLLKSGLLSTSQGQSVTHSSYKKALINLYRTVDRAPAKNIQYLNSLAAAEQPEADAFIRRDYVYRTQHQIEAEGAKILMEAADMIDPSLKMYPNPTRDCSWMCDFTNACILMDTGEDWEEELLLSTIERSDTNENESWRKYV